MTAGLFDRSRLVSIRLSLLLITVLLAAGSARATPFEVVKGSWIGGGKMNFKDGRSEMLDCKAYYTSSEDGKALTTALRCSGPSGKLELRSHLSHASGKVSGSWEERTYNASGETSGTLNTGNLQLHFRGAAAGSMTVEFSAARQTISIAIASVEVPVQGMQFNMKRQ